LNVVGAIVILAFAGFWSLQLMKGSASTGAGAGPTGAANTAGVTGSKGVVGALGAAIRGTQVVVDEEIAVDARGAQMRGVTMPSERPVQVQVEGKTHADKGFTVYVMALSEWDNFQNGKQFRQLPSFEGLKVRSFGHVETLPAGSWAVVVQNSENIFNTMVVHLKITIDPV
jgi:hypothetical protein